jgi:hypothetical protein
MSGYMNQTTTIVAIIGILIAIYFVYNMTTKSTGHISTEHVHTENFTHELGSQEDNRSQDGSVMSGSSGEISNKKVYGDYVANDRYYKTEELPKENLLRQFPQKDYAPPEQSELAGKFKSRNKATNGYKRSSYSGSLRGNLGTNDWASYFDHNNNIVTNSQTGDNDKFLPIDEANGGLAVFKSQGRATCGSNQNCEPEDLFDADKYLPQEVNDDWFEVQQEPISVKNRHLVNITKPIGVDTIGSSKKNMSYDIRGAPANPKFVVAPWLQSSIEPDTNLKPLY